MFQVNMLAVLVVAMVDLAIGISWYSPYMFGKTWRKLLGKSERDEKATPWGYVAAFCTSIVMAYVLAHFVVFFTRANTLADGAIVGFWAWMGFVATSTLASVLWEGRKFKLYLIFNIKNMVSLVIMGMLLAVWP